MKLINLVPKFMMLNLNAERTIQFFGRARLVQFADGRYELVGGTRADFTAAKEWISLFGHEIVLSAPANIRRPFAPSSN